MKKKSLFLSTLLCLLIAITGVASASSHLQHPQIVKYQHQYVWDWDLEEEVYELTVLLVLDEAVRQPAELRLRSVDPASGDFTVHWSGNPTGVRNRQAERFVRYTINVLSCMDGLATTHVYDHHRTQNPNSSISIDHYATDLGQLRVQSGWCPTRVMPPPVDQNWFDDRFQLSPLVAAQ